MMRGNTLLWAGMALVLMLGMATLVLRIGEGAVESFIGCYRVVTGDDRAVLFGPTPEVIQLLGEPAEEVVSAGLATTAYRVRSVSTPNATALGEMMRSWWVPTGPRSFEVVTSSGSFGAVLHLTRRGDRVEGQVRPFVDVVGEEAPPYPVSGTRTACNAR